MTGARNCLRTFDDPFRRPHDIQPSFPIRGVLSLSTQLEKSTQFGWGGNTLRFLLPSSAIPSQTRKRFLRTDWNHSRNTPGEGYKITDAPLCKVRSVANVQGSGIRRTFTFLDLWFHRKTRACSGNPEKDVDEFTGTGSFCNQPSPFPFTPLSNHQHSPRASLLPAISSSSQPPTSTV